MKKHTEPINCMPLETNNHFIRKKIKIVGSIDHDARSERILILIYGGLIYINMYFLTGYSSVLLYNLPYFTIKRVDYTHLLAERSNRPGYDFLWNLFHG